MSDSNDDLSAPLDTLLFNSASAEIQRAVLELQLPVVLTTGALLLLAAALDLIAPTPALIAILVATVALLGAWLLRAQLPLWSMQLALLIAVATDMWSLSSGGNTSAIMATGVIALAMIAAPATRIAKVVALLLMVGAAITANLGAAFILLLCAVLAACAVIAPLRTQLAERDAARRYAESLLAERERLLVDFRQRNEGFRRLLEKDAEQKSTQLQRTNRELREANDHLEAFNYMVSHDIRASLRVLDGLANVLLEDIHSHRPAVALQNLHRLHTSIGNMHGMVKELLNMSRPDRRVQRHRVDLGAIIHELVQDLRTAEPHRKVSVQIADNLIAYGQPDLIREALQNLLFNAWKFTAQRPDAHIEFGVSDQGEPERVFYVRDNGVGIDMQRAAEMFQPFKRLHDEPHYEGTGVGLASVKRIIERHGGRVWAQAEPVQGTKLCFTLGLQSVDEQVDAVRELH